MPTSPQSTVNSQQSRNLKVALVADWLTGVGGAERVILELHRMFPDAPIYTSQYNPAKLDWFTDADVRVGWMQKLPLGLRKFLPVLRLWYFSRLDLSEYDLIISDTGAEAKAVRFQPKPSRLSHLLAVLGGSENRKGDVHDSTLTADRSSQQRNASENTSRVNSSAVEQAGMVRKPVHICICNAPTHYYWSRYEAYLENPGFPKGFNWLARLGLRLLVGPLRRWDRRLAQRPTRLTAISTHIQREIQKYYGRDSVVIAPPVDIERLERRTENGERRTGFVTVGRQTPYKRIDLAVAACTKLGLPLTVIGNGPQHEELVRLAGPTLTFVTDATDEDVVRYVAGAEAFLFPGLDDFGIAPVEAMAAGTPVIAYHAGGALDYVIEGKTGLFFDEQTVESLAEALEKFDPKQFKPALIKSHAQKFSTENFRKKLSELLRG